MSLNEDRFSLEEAEKYYSHKASCDGVLQPPVLPGSRLYVCDVCSFAIEAEPRQKFVALYVSTAKYGVNGITLHRTAADAYASLVDYLQIGNEADPEYADDKVPTDLDELIDWCQEKGDEQGTDWYCTEVEVPPN